MAGTAEIRERSFSVKTTIFHGKKFADNLIMALKIVHIDKETIVQEAEVRSLWENVLKPKWEEQARKRAEKLFSRLKPGQPPREPDRQTT